MPARKTRVKARRPWVAQQEELTKSGVNMLRIALVAVLIGLPVAASAQPVEYVVGTWNLEHFHDGASRGFPENRSGGPSFPTRSNADYLFVASTIKAVDAKILVLVEINGETAEVTDPGDEDEEEDERSPELDRLVTFLGNTYEYVIGTAGDTQRIAILYDTKFARLNEACETSFRNIKVQKKSVFDRQPVYAHFTFLENGAPRNDLVVVGVHLASGQHLHLNHDKAMTKLVEEIDASRAEEFCVPKREFDVLITGDFNANRFGGPVEKFWDQMEGAGWDVLADAPSYPATRLSGNPLQQRTSQIDYIIVSKGLKGKEVAAPEATVHEGLLGANPPNDFRSKGSDHLPVTVKVKVVNDTD
jgi:endonuclease/exonuclease/phosphatase family metal-dependent hydrolase